MSAAKLTLVDPSQTESPAARARRLLAEARSAAAEQVEQLEVVLAEVGVIAVEIADGGEAYPPGARDLARRIADDVTYKAQTLQTLMRHARS